MIKVTQPECGSWNWPLLCHLPASSGCALAVWSLCMHRALSVIRITTWLASSASYQSQIYVDVLWLIKLNFIKVLSKFTVIFLKLGILSIKECAEKLSQCSMGIQRGFCQHWLLCTHEYWDNSNSTNYQALISFSRGMFETGPLDCIYQGVSAHASKCLPSLRGAWNFRIIEKALRSWWDDPYRESRWGAQPSARSRVNPL